MTTPTITSECCRPIPNTKGTLSSLSDTPRNFAGSTGQLPGKKQAQSPAYTIDVCHHCHTITKGKEEAQAEILAPCYESSSFVWAGKQNPLSNRKRRIVKANSKGAQDQWESHPQQRNPGTTSSAMVLPFCSPGRAAQAPNPETKPFCFHLSVQSSWTFSYYLSLLHPLLSPALPALPTSSLCAQARCKALPSSCNYKMSHLTQTSSLNCIFLGFSIYTIQRPMRWVIS